jgi:hypothetical protein
MATNPFSGVGLGQLGQDQSYTTGGGPLSNAISGVKDVLMTGGIKASGLQDYLNGLGGNTAVPPPASNPVAPMAPAAPMAPPVAPVMDMGAAGMGTGAMESILHPEVASTLLTALF